MAGLDAEPVNPARKAWQEIEQFLYQFADPREPQLICSFLDGLASVALAALHLGNFDVIAFEKDRATWEAAGEIVTKQIEKLQAKEAALNKKLQQNIQEFNLVNEIQTGKKKKIDEDEVSFDTF